MVTAFHLSCTGVAMAQNISILKGQVKQAEKQLCSLFAFVFFQHNAQRFRVPQAAGLWLLCSVWEMQVCILMSFWLNKTPLSIISLNQSNIKNIVLFLGKVAVVFSLGSSKMGFLTTRNDFSLNMFSALIAHGHHGFWRGRRACVNYFPCSYLTTWSQRLASYCLSFTSLLYLSQTVDLRPHDGVMSGLCNNRGDGCAVTSSQQHHLTASVFSNMLSSCCSYSRWLSCEWCLDAWTWYSAWCRGFSVGSGQKSLLICSAGLGFG